MAIWNENLQCLNVRNFRDYIDNNSNFIQMKNISLPGIHHTAKFFVIQLFVPRDVKSGKSCLDLMVDWIGGLHWRIGLVDRMVDWIGLDCRAIIIYLDANVFFSDVARNHNYSEFLPKHIKAVSAMRWLIQRQGKHVQCWWHLVGLLWLRYCSYLCHGEILTQFIEILEKIQWNPQILSRLILSILKSQEHKLSTLS